MKNIVFVLALFIFSICNVYGYKADIDLILREGDKVKRENGEV